MLAVFYIDSAADLPGTAKGCASFKKKTKNIYIYIYICQVVLPPVSRSAAVM